MADLLSLAEWKPRVKEGRDLDDLLKPLEAYAKARGDASRRREALEGVIGAAREIRGKNARDKDLAKDLGGVLTAAEKARAEVEKELEELKAQELVKKAKGKIADEVSFDPELVKHLLVVRNIGPDKARHFVIALGKPAGMAISKTPVTKRHKQQARKWRKGKGKLLEGTCYGEGGKYIFDFGPVKPPAGLAKTIKGAALSQAEKSIKLKVRGGGVDLDDELDTADLEDLGDDNPEDDAPDEDEADESPDTETIAAEAAEATRPDDSGKADFDRRLKEVGEFARRAAYLSNGLSMLGGRFLRDAQAFFEAGRAEDALKALETLRGMAEAAYKAAGPDAEARIAAAQKAEADKAAAKDDPAARFTERLKGLQGRIKEAVAAGGDLGAEVRRLTGEAGGLARKKDFERAEGLLDRIEAALKAPAAPAAGGEPSPSAMARWRTARDETVGRLRLLARSVAGTGHPLAAESLVEINSVLKALAREPISPERSEALRDYLTRDDVVADICDLAFDFREPLMDALEPLAGDARPN